MLADRNRLRQLTPVQRALLELRLRKRASLPDGDGIPCREPNVLAPCSSGQQRFWFQSRLAPADPALNCPLLLQIRGQVKPYLLERSLAGIVARHEILRTTIEASGEGPVQKVAPGSDVPMPVVNLRSLSPAERETMVRCRVREHAHCAFDLAHGPSLRACLLELADGESLLLLNFPHAAFDGWSADVFIRELATLYEGYATGRTALLPELPIQYADYATWQRKRFEQHRDTRLLGYWMQQLEGAATVLELPTDRPRVAVQAGRGGQAVLTLPEGLAEAIREVGRREGATLFMTLLATFQILVHRYSGQDDLIIGCPVAGRTRLELEQLIGFFVNTLPLRARIVDNPTFVEFLRTVRQTALEAYEHQELPFERLVEAIRPARDRSRIPLVQVLFQVRDARRPPIQAAGVILESCDFDTGVAPCDLRLDITPGPHGLDCRLMYDADLFEEETATRLLGAYRALIEGVVAAPETRVAFLPLLPPAERQKILIDWNATARPAGDEAGVQALVERQADRRPDATAVVCGAASLTYRQLNEKANQLAHHLCSMGVGPNVPVGVYVDRSVDMVVALLAVWKAGGAYVPLDPNFPRERLSFYIEDSRMPVVLTQPHLTAHLSPHQAVVIVIDADVIKDESRENLPARSTRENWAYVLYTSGSSGRPKGVPVPQRALLNLLAAMRREPGLTEDDVLLSVTTMAFDIHALELWLPLAIGARVVVASRRTAMDGVELLRELERCRATVLQATPATWRLLLAAGWKGFPGFRALCGGEALSSELASMLGQRVSSLWNLYGPTETTVWSTRFHVQEVGSVIPIGRPIDNTRVYVLDANREPVPVGVPGELYIGGEGVACGYLNRHELTEQCFVPDCFGDARSHRLYRTHDRVRWRTDGNLEFIGRIDRQVKIRGYRIEPSEVEAVLARHTTVHACAVTICESTPGDRVLAAYVVPRDPGSSLDVPALRRHLARTLPDYSVPAVFIQLDALPVTPNGKTDLHALPRPAAFKDAGEHSEIQPQTRTEAILAGIWTDVLGTGSVDIHADFFELGGHSLLAVNLIDRVNQQLGTKLTLADLFQAPTVARLAQHVAAPPSVNRNGNHGLLEVIRPGNGGTPVVCVAFSHPHRALLEGLSAEVPLWGLWLSDLRQHPSRIRSFEAMTMELEAELLKAAPSGPLILVGFSFGGLLAFELTVRLRRSGRSVQTLLLEPTVPKPLWAHARFENSQTEPWRRCLSRHARALRRLSMMGRLRYCWERLTNSSVVRRVLIRPYLQLRAEFGAPVLDAKQHWWYYEAELRRRLADYKLATCRGNVFVAGRRTWLDVWTPAWQSVIEGYVEPCVLPTASSHLDINAPAVAAAWLVPLQHRMNGG